ncbi:MAG: preprotein translocase subunit SecG [Mycoplasmoidaceae bacterium]|nr:preprotein translocase subunit SecG [Mycoplasmoidaceae bacterium]
MSWVSILILVLAIICLIIGLMLSGSGSTNGLTNVIGQDLELFKKTKDRGFIKILQMTMFIIMVVMLVLLILSLVLG